jgi:hypothetical protein
VISSSYNGTCPTVYCPCLHQNKEKKPLKYKDWSQVVELISFANQFENLAKGLVSFRCGKCHEQSSIFVDYSKTKKSEAIFKAHFDEQTYCKITKSLRQYVRGEIQVDEIYMSVTEKLRVLERRNSNVKVDDTFREFLLLIKNPERRINLHLRYLRDNPKVKSNCCKANHCFNCKIYGFHEGKKCEEVEENFCNDVLKCPGCGISLVKGEGCDTITCVCGRTFSWEWEKVEGVKYRRFLAQYPDDTHVHCAEVLCKNNTICYTNNFNPWIWGYNPNFHIYDSDEIVWYDIHKIEVDKHFSTIFERLYIKHKPYIYAVLAHPDYSSNNWIKKGIDDFFKSNQKENDEISELVKCYEKQVNITHKHILDTFSGGSEEENYKILYNKSCFSYLLPDSFKRNRYICCWIEKKITAKMAQCFFYLYRNRRIKQITTSDLVSIKQITTLKCIMLDNQEHQKLFNYFKVSAEQSLLHAIPIFTSSDIDTDALKMNDPNKWVEICNEESPSTDLFCSTFNDMTKGDIGSVTITFDKPNVLNYEQNLKLVQSILSNQAHFFPKEPKSISLNCLANFFDIREIIYDIFDINLVLRRPHSKLNNVNSRYGKNRKNEPTWNEICSALAWYVHNYKVIDEYDSLYDKLMNICKNMCEDGKVINKVTIINNGNDIDIWIWLN